MEFVRSDGVKVFDDYEFESSTKTTKTYRCGCTRSWIRYFVGEKSMRGDITCKPCGNSHCMISFSHFLGLDEKRLTKMKAIGIKLNVRL